MDLTTQQVPIATLTRHPKNARQGDVGAISDSLARNGQYVPIVVNAGTHTGRPNEVLRGWHTSRAAEALGWESIAAVVVDLAEDAALRVLAADNRTSDLAAYDDAALAELLTTLGGDYGGTGFDGDDLDDLLAALDRSPAFVAPPADPAAPTQPPADPADPGMRQTASFADNAADYATRGTRMMVLQYPTDAYAWVVQGLARVAADVIGDPDATNTAVVAYLVGKALGETPPEGTS